MYIRLKYLETVNHDGSRYLFLVLCKYTYIWYTYVDTYILIMTRAYYYLHIVRCITRHLTFVLHYQTLSVFYIVIFYHFVGITTDLVT